MRLMLIAIAAALLAGPSAAAAPAANVAADPARRGAVLNLLEARMAQDHIPGLQIAIVQNGRIVLTAAMGVANLEHGRPVTPDTRFSINSATKSFTGVAVMQLVEAGRLALDAPIGRYLQDLPPAWAAVPLHDLLSHQSGLPDIIDGDGVIGTSEAEAWRLVTAKPQDAAVGARFAYNQTNYALLGRIIAAQAGIGFAGYLQQRQFGPAAMNRTLLGDSEDIIPDRAQSYSFYRQLRGGAEIKGNVLGHWRDVFPPFMRTGAGIVTTATDMAHWMIALQDGRLMRGETRARMWQRDQLADGRPGDWAMGWPVLESRGRRIVAGIGGARSAFFVYPDHGLAIVVLTNLAGANPQRFIDDIAELYLGPPTR